MNDELLQIKNVHLAIYHLLLGHLAYQQVLNDEIADLIAEKKDYELKSYQNALNKRAGIVYQKLLNITYSKYGVVDLDDILKSPLRPDED